MSDEEFDSDPISRKREEDIDELEEENEDEDDEVDTPLEWDKAKFG